jgi:preprotein translocase subunit SecB
VSGEAPRKAILEVDEVLIESLSVAAHEPYSADDPVTAQMTAGFMVAFAEGDSHSFRVQLTVTVSNAATEGPGNLPYGLNASLRGAFRTPIDIVNETIPASLANNAISILYGALRGAVLNLTGMSINGALCLPSVNFETLTMGAASKSGTGVVPDIRTRSQAVGAQEYYRLRFALEDLQRAIPVIEPGSRGEISANLGVILAILSQTPTEVPPDMSRPIEAANAIARLAANDRSALAPLLQVWAGAISSGVITIAQGVRAIAISDAPKGHDTESPPTPVDPSVTQQ